MKFTVFQLAEGKYKTVDSQGSEVIYESLDSLFNGLLFAFEGRSPSQGSDRYGIVVLARNIV